MSAEKIPYSDVQWALKNEVHVTLIDAESGHTTYLVARVHIGPIPSGQYSRPWGHALVLDFDDDTLVINGQDIPESNDPEELLKWATLVEGVSLSPYLARPGEYVTTRLER